MDFRELLKGKTVNDLENILENWYARLNRLKDKYGEPINGIENEKARKLIFSLINRLSFGSQLFIRASAPKPNFPHGASY